MQFDPMKPIWAQVAAALQTDMVTGRLAPGAKMPSGRDLAVRFTINPNTAARVYQELVSQGLCETRRGLGTYVTEDTTRLAELRDRLAREAAARFLAELGSLGLTRADAVSMIEKEES